VPWSVQAAMLVERRVVANGPSTAATKKIIPSSKQQRPTASRSGIAVQSRSGGHALDDYLTAEVGTHPSPESGPLSSFVSAPSSPPATACLALC